MAEERAALVAKIKARAQEQRSSYEVIFLGKTDVDASWDVRDEIAPQRVTFGLTSKRYACDCAAFQATNVGTCVHVEIVALDRASRRPAPPVAAASAPAPAAVAAPPPEAARLPARLPELPESPAPYEVSALGFLGRLVEGLGMLYKREGELLEAVRAQTAVLERLAAGGLAGGGGEAAEEAPDYRFPLAQWKDFDWSSIGADVVEQDEDGVTLVRWGHKTWKRRSPDNKFDAAIWYNRVVGREADGTVRYERLITFAVSKVEPLGRKAAKEAGL